MNVTKNGLQAFAVVYVIYLAIAIAILWSK